MNCAAPAAWHGPVRRARTSWSPRLGGEILFVSVLCYFDLLTVPVDVIMASNYTMSVPRRVDPSRSYHPSYTLIKCYLWANPGGTAMPGRPVTGVERAPNIPSIYKNQFNILVPHDTSQILQWVESANHSRSDLGLPNKIIVDIIRGNWNFGLA
ncbi:hypothetical protein K1T71_013063 [Dendrolimus kikuchii]|uniref:Uncharacterized protein n=1 Tax=Dendrolimus kikuchii TaxID=765133 RepID=A0ACC1CIV2_9NEOP|nr:hypothetical protein K1T71_013063 [Dendrolimus kikuchii]